MNLQNTRAQDLFLLAKRHYTAPAGDTLADTARRLVGVHNLYDPERMPWRDAAEVVVGDLIEAGVLDLSGRKLTQFLISLGPHPVALLGADLDQPGAFYGVLIDKVMSEVAVTRVRGDDGQWHMPFPMPTPDPGVAAILARHASEAA